MGTFHVVNCVIIAAMTIDDHHICTVSAYTLTSYYIYDIMRTTAAVRRC
jgi:hypothetical protein